MGWLWVRSLWCYGSGGTVRFGLWRRVGMAGAGLGQRRSLGNGGMLFSYVLRLYAIDALGFHLHCLHLMVMLYYSYIVT